ncbi:MAG: aspartyl/asparaginyl beta-hydroxylase domain-containing protein [Planctomycetota bacterium]
MLLDAAEFSFSTALQRHFETFADELRELVRDDFLEWPDRAAYGGSWLIAALFMSSHIAGIEDTFMANQAKCPASTAVLRSIPGVTAAAFSWMDPGCHIYAHRDVKALDVMRAHLPLEVPAGAQFRVGEDVHEWHTGESLLFEGYLEHETGNAGSKRRIVLLVDAQLSGTDLEKLQDWRRRNRIEIAPKLVLVDAFGRETVEPGPVAAPSDPVVPAAAGAAGGMA